MTDTVPAVRLLVDDLETAGVQLWEESGNLRFRAPAGVMTDDRRALLRGHKDVVLDLLRRRSREVGITTRPAERFEPFPLTDMQAAYLLGRRAVFRHGGVSCHGYGELAFPELDSTRLEAAWQALIERHDMLRAVIGTDGTQRILPDVPGYRIEEIDLRAPGVSIEAIREELGHRVYQPDQWPMFDLRVSRDDGGARLHFSIDFLIVDFVSTQLLLDELHQLYHDASCHLSTTEISFRDYVLAERELRESQHYHRDREYWLARLDDLPPAPELPVLGGEPGPRFRRWAATLTPAEWACLRAAAGRRGITPSVAVLTAFAEVIGRWSRHPRFTLDLTLQNRLPLHPQVGRLVGDFTSVELLAVELAATLTDSANAIQARLWEDLDHRLFSGLEVMREVVRRQGPEAGLFPVVFTSAIGVEAGEDGRLRGLSDVVYGITQTPQVWIDCQVLESRGGLRFNWDVRDGIFPDGLIDDMFAAFERLLHRMVAEGDVWDQADVVVLPTDQLERRRSANDTARPLPAALLHEALVAQALRAPDRPAVVDPLGALSYGDLLGQATALAAELADAGPIVGVLLDKGRDQVVAVLGVLLAGAAYLPLDTDQPAARRERILRDAGVRYVVTTLHTQVPAGVRRVDLAALDAGPVPTVAPPRRVDPDDLAYVIYTSGSTGPPKGVMISHRSAVNTIADINQRFDVRAHDRVLGLAALGFDLSVYDIFGVLAVGGALVLPSHDRRADPSHWVESINAHRVTVWNSVPAQLQMLHDYLATGGSSVASLRLAMLSGDWIPVRLPDQIRARVPGLRVVSLGGATEAAIWSIWYPIEVVSPQWRSIPYGKPLTNQTFHVLDAAMRDRPDWVAGDLYIGGAGVARGYLGDEAKTAERFIRHPELGRLYRTGDLGRYLPDGSIEFLGREDRQIKVRGHRIELAEVEEAIRAHAGVAGAIVVADPERRLAAFVEPERRPVVQEAPPVPVRIELAEAVAAEVTTAVDESGYREYAAALDHASLLTMLSALAATRERTPDRLARRWIRALSSAGRVNRESRAGDLELLSPVEPDVLESAWRRVAELSVADDPRLIDYFQTNARQLPALLRGEADPLALLFPDGELAVCEAVYAGPLPVRWANRAIAAVVQQLAPERILEVGGGTGATTAEVLSAAPDAELTFTDISPFFVGAARQRFGDGAARYAVLDLDEEYRPQGIVPNAFDVIVAGDVLHAVRDVDVTLPRLREILRPGGWLVFSEVTRDTYPFMASLELLLRTEFTDSRRDRDEIFLDDAQWCESLERLGAEPVLCLPVAGEPLIRQSGIRVFAARMKPDRVRLAVSGLQTHLEQRLPEYMVPSHIQVVDALPLSANGKIDYRTLQTWLPPAQPPSVSADESASELESALMRVWGEVLARQHVGRNQGFLALGGDSLLAARLAGRLREDLALDMPFDTLLRRILEGPTVAELAAWLSSAAPSQSGPVTMTSPVRRLGGSGVGPVRVLVHDGAGTLSYYESQIEHLMRTGPLVGLEVVDPDAYLGLEPAILVERMADEYAEALLDADCLSVEIVGAREGTRLAVEIARRLAETGADVHRLVLVEPAESSEPGSPLATHLAAALAEFRPAPYAGDVTLVRPGAELDDWRIVCLGDVAIADDIVAAMR